MDNQAKTVIKLKCIDQTLQLTEKPTIASGGVEASAVEFAFDGLWDGFTRCAVFYRKPYNVYHVPITDGACVIPHEVLGSPGCFYLGVMGVKDGVTRTSTVLSYRVEAGAITEGISPPEPTPSIYEAMLASMRATEQIAQSVRDDADAGKFKGAKGDKGERGEKGEKGDPGERGANGADAPQIDVQVNGESVLNGGIANVPLASHSRAGVVEVGSGIDVLENGTIFIPSTYPPSIDYRTPNAAVTADMLDYAVKAAMTDGKGAAWTAAEQQAARGRIGCFGLRLIEEITVDDDTTLIQRFTEPDGTPYNFSKVLIIIGDDKNEEVPAGINENGIRICCNEDSAGGDGSVVAFIPGESTEIDATIEYDSFLSITAVGRLRYYNGSYQMQNYSKAPSDKRIEALYIGHYTGLTPGVVIKIWGRN